MKKNTVKNINTDKLEISERMFNFLGKALKAENDKLWQDVEKILGDEKVTIQIPKHHDLSEMKGLLIDAKERVKDERRKREY